MQIGAAKRHRSGYRVDAMRPNKQRAKEITRLRVIFSLTFAIALLFWSVMFWLLLLALTPWVRPQVNADLLLQGSASNSAFRGGLAIAVAGAFLTCRAMMRRRYPFRPRRLIMWERMYKRPRLGSRKWSIRTFGTPDRLAVALPLVLLLVGIGLAVWIQGSRGHLALQEGQLIYHRGWTSQSDVMTLDGIASVQPTRNVRNNRGRPILVINLKSGRTLRVNEISMSEVQRDAFAQELARRSGATLVH